MARDPLEPLRCAELLAALAAPERLRIVRYLAEGEHTVSEIAEMLTIPAVNLSHHLTVMKSARLICGDKKGRFVWYRLAPGILEEVIDAGIPKEALDLGCCRLVLPFEGKACDAASSLDE